MPIQPKNAANRPGLLKVPGSVNYLDTVSATEFAQSYKQRTFDILGLEEGMQVLEVGCGTGEDAVGIARRVGASGRVVAVDRNPTMVAEGLKRARSAGVRVDFRLGDAGALEFPDGSFDASRSDRVFQHLADPVRALAEMVRVTRSGGRVLISEPDWEGLIIDSADRSLTRRIVNYTCDHGVPHGWIGRQLWGMFHRAGLMEIVVHSGMLILRDLETANQIWGLERHARQAQEAGVVTAEEVDTWLRELREAERHGIFFSAAVGFVVCGNKP
jgi:ubiquinone/menaquinone biosynthesis C-methylase UbiE